MVVAKLLPIILFRCRQICQIYARQIFPTIRTVFVQLFTYFALPEVDREVDKLRVLLDKFPEARRFEVLLSFFLEEEGDGGASFEGGATRIGSDGEPRGIGLPDVLVIVVVLGCYHD